MNKEEAIKYLSEHWGKKGRFEDDDGDATIGILCGVDINGQLVDGSGYSWDAFTPEPEKKKRLLTPTELRGKNLCYRDTWCDVVAGDDNTVWMSYADAAYTVEELNRQGWEILNDDGSTSPLEIEE